MRISRTHIPRTIAVAPKPPPVRHHIRRIVLVCLRHTLGLLPLRVRARLVPLRTGDPTRRVHHRRRAAVLVRLRLRGVVLRATDASERRVDEANESVHGTLGTEQDAVEAAEEVRVEGIVEQAPEPVDVLCVLGEVSRSDELAVGVSAELDGVWRTIEVEDGSESLCERHRHRTSEPALRRDCKEKELSAKEGQRHEKRTYFAQERR
jgi:hypothetical protein